MLIINVVICSIYSWGLIPCRKGKNKTPLHHTTNSDSYPITGPVKVLEPKLTVQGSHK